MQKETLRKEYKKKRKSLSLSEIEKLQESIYKQVFEYDFSEVKKVHVFLPIEKQKEINTYPIIEFLRSKGKEIIVSKSNFLTHTLQHFVFEQDTVLEINSYGIPEPKDAKEIMAKEIDLVFVPLLISDKQNYRVGYGKGFYDRFLASCSKSVKTIGLNFFRPISEIKDKNKFDVPLDTILCPKTLL